MSQKANKLTEILKQSFYVVGIITFIIFLNTNLRPENTGLHQAIQSTQAVQPEVIEKTIIINKYIDINTLGLIFLGLFTIVVVIGVLYSFNTGIKTYAKNKEEQTKKS